MIKVIAIEDLDKICEILDEIKNAINSHSSSSTTENNSSDEDDI